MPTIKPDELKNVIREVMMKEGSVRLTDPIPKLAAEFQKEAGLDEDIFKASLIYLQSQHALTLEFDERFAGGIQALTLAESEWPTERAVLLVDYDNVMTTTQDIGFTVSFNRIHERALAFGRLAFAFVFTSPRSYETSRAIEMLYNAGFQVVRCPMQYKDRDAVDAKMREMADRFLELEGVETIIVVSRDADFVGLGPAARKLHKRTVFLDIRDSELFSGEDPIPTRVSSKHIAMYEDLITKDASLNGHREQAQFLLEVMDAAAEVTRPAKEIFNVIESKVQILLRNRPIRMKPRETKPALSALNNLGILKRSDEEGISYYQIDETDPRIEAFRQKVEQGSNS